jgi:hypothetical protein
MKKIFFTLITITLLSSQLTAQDTITKKNFYNDPININRNPNYILGDYPLPDINDAKTYFQMKKSEIITPTTLKTPGYSFTTGIGEITFSSTKDETNKVLGYFRNYIGFLQTKGMNIHAIKLVIDINSLDTAVAGRNNRILDLFFKSSLPANGTALVDFSKIQTKSLRKQENNTQYTVIASGTLSLNGISSPIKAKLNITHDKEVWTIETVDALQLNISDLGYKNEIYDLLKSCNHKSIGNGVEIKTKLYLR